MCVICMVLPSQVLKVSSQTMHGSVDDSSDLLVTKASWQEHARSWVCQKSEPQKKVSKQKLYRVAAFHIARSLDHQLRMLGADGLCRFKPMGTGGREPVLSLCMDQGSCGYAASWFLLYHESMKLNMVFLQDPAHRCWNDIRGAIVDSGFWGHILLTTVAYNAQFGPWATESVWADQKESMEEFITLSGPQCQIWQELLPLICRDLGLEHEVPNVEVLQELWDEMPSCSAWEAKGEKVALCRWMSWLDVASGFDTTWHRRLALILFMGMREGWLKFEDKHLCIVSGDAPAEEAPKAQVRHSDQAAGLRQKTKNTLHLCCSILLNPEMQNKSRLIFRLASPIREWHGHNVQAQRSQAASGEYYAKQAQGEFCESLCKSWGQLQDLASLEFIGLKCTPTPEWKGMSVDAGAVMSEDQVATDAGTFCLNLANRRLQSMLQYFKSFPGLFALMIPNKPDLDQSLLNQMKQAAEAHEGLETEAPQVAFVKLMLSRSVFQQSVVQMMFKLAAAASYEEVTGEMRDLAHAMFSVVGQTKVIEDGFNRCRKNEQHGGNGTLVMDNLRKYMAPVSSKVLDEVHNFKTVDWRGNRAVDRGNQVQAGLPKNMFVCSGKHASMPLQQVVNKKAKTSWHSFSPATSVTLHCDLAVEQYCKENNCFDLAPNCWLSYLLPQGKLIRRAGTKEWALSLGHYGNAGLTWPLEQVTASMWRPATKVTPTMVRWAVVLDLEHWEGMDVRWRSPMHAHLGGKAGRGAKKVVPGICLEAVGKAVPILKLMASGCFCGIPEAGLAKLIKHMGYEMPPSPSLFTKLSTLLTNILHCSDAALVQLLEMRLDKSQEDLMQLVEMDDVADLCETKEDARTK
jgi:hypothetical protein